MSLAFRNSVCEFVLEMDKELPEQERPTFLFRYPSYHEFFVIEETMAKAETSEGREQFDKYLEACSLPMVGWRNLGIDFDKSKLSHVLSLNDVVEMRLRLLDELTLSEIDKKKFKLQQRSNSTHSVKETEKVDTAATAPIP